MPFEQLRPDSTVDWDTDWTVNGGTEPDDVLANTLINETEYVEATGASIAGLIDMTVADPTFPSDAKIKACRIIVGDAHSDADVSFITGWSVPSHAFRHQEWTTEPVDGSTPVNRTLDWQEVDPIGDEWTFEQVESVRLRLRTTKAFDSDWLRVYLLAFEVEYNERPTVTITAPSATVSDTTQPTVEWDYADAENDPQDRFEVRVYDAADIFGAAPTDPDEIAADPVYEVVESGNVGFHDVADDLDDGTTYRVYVRARQEWSGEGEHWSEWDSAEFTLDLDTPAAPQVTLTAEHSDARVRIDLADDGSGDVGAAWFGVQFRDASADAWQWVRDGREVSVLPWVEPDDSQTVPALSSGSFQILYGLAYGDGLWVTVGSEGSIYTSSDGTDWTEPADSRSVTSSDLRAVAYGNGTWVATGINGTVITSSNGTDWSEPADSGTVVTATPWGIAYAAGLWAAVGAGGSIYTSSNGTDWSEPADSGSVTTETLRSVDHDGSTWVATGRNGTIITSSDGTSWSEPADSGTVTTEDLDSIAHGDSTWVAVGGGGTIITSSDGTSWSEPADSGSVVTDALEGVVHADGKWVAVGWNGVIIISSGGTSWSEMPASGSLTDETLQMVAHGGDTWVATGWDGTIITSAAAPVLYDYEAPLNVGREYRARSFHELTGVVAGPSTLDTATLDTGNTRWLKDPHDPTRNTIIRAQSYSHSRRGREEVHRPVGMSAAVVEAEEPGGLDGSYSIVTRTSAQYDAVRDLVDSPGTLLLQDRRHSRYVRVTGDRSFDQQGPDDTGIDLINVTVVETTRPSVD